MKPRQIPPCPKCGRGFPTVQFLAAEKKLVCTHCGIQGTPSAKQKPARRPRLTYRVVSCSCGHRWHSKWAGAHWELCPKCSAYAYRNTLDHLQTAPRK